MVLFVGLTAGQAARPDVAAEDVSPGLPLPLGALSLDMSLAYRSAHVRTGILIAATERRVSGAIDGQGREANHLELAFLDPPGLKC